MPSNKTKRPAANARTPLPLWKKAPFAALTLVIFFGLLELTLYVAGMNPILYEEDPYVGFASQIPLFVEQQDAAGGVAMVTAQNKLRFFNQQSFSKEKGKDVTRIFCLGGSTTYGRPYDDATSFCGWLRGLLPAADPAREWELINAGGISYASYRVAALMEELSAYEPDIFIVYCGQNEFLEQRTYAGIIDTPAPVRGLTALLSRTRVYATAARLAGTFRSSPSTTDGNTQHLSGEVNTILDQSVGPKDYLRDTELQEKVLAHYRYNMARIADIARGSGAQIIFVTPASNLRSCSPFKSQHRDGLDAEQKQQWDTLFRSATEHFVGQRFAAALKDLDQAAEIDDRYAQSHYLHGRVLDALQQYEDAKTAYQRAVDEDVCPLRALSPMRDIVIDVARERQVPVVDFGLAVENDSPQGIPGEELFLDHVHPTIDAHRMLALAIVDEMARQKMVTPSSGWNDAAIERVAASITSGIDRKAQGAAMRNLSIVYSWAGKQEDAYRAAKQALELHPGDAETHYQVGFLAQQLGKTEEAVERLRYLTAFDLTPEAIYYLRAHLQLAAILGERGEYTECERVLRKLLRLDPDNADALQQLPILLTRQARQLIQSGQPATAATKLAEVERLQPDNLEVKNQLAVALIQSGDGEAAIPLLRAIIEARPDYLPAYGNLSAVLAQLRRFDEAEDVCRKALRIDPNYAPAQRNLQMILREKAGAN